MSTLKCLLVQGGGAEHQYDVPLANGCDILVSATPFCIVRLLGTGHTNLERLRHLCLDDAHTLVGQYGRQMRGLFRHYHNVLLLNERQAPAQIVALSAVWAPRLANMADDYMFEPVLVADNKLEASCMAGVRHVLTEARNVKCKYLKLAQLVQSISIGGSGNKHTVIFVHGRLPVLHIHELLVNTGYYNVACVHEHSPYADIERTQRIWNNWTAAAAEEEESRASCETTQPCDYDDHDDNGINPYHNGSDYRNGVSAKGMLFCIEEVNKSVVLQFYNG